MSRATGRNEARVHHCLMMCFGIVISGASYQLSSSPVVVRETQTASFRWQLPSLTDSSLISLYVINPAGTGVLLVDLRNNQQQIALNYTARITYTGDMSAKPKVMAFDLRSVVSSDAGNYTCGNNGITDIIPQCGQKLVIVVPQLSSSPVVVREHQTASFRWQLPTLTGSSPISLYVISPVGTGVLLVTVNTNQPQIAPNYTARVNYTGNMSARSMVMAFDLSSVDRSDAGAYTCGRNGLSDLIPQCGQKLVVLGQPTKCVINVPSAPLFGRQVTLTCISTSTTMPTNHGLTLTYIWQLDNSDITVTSPGSLYTFTVNSRDSHSYRCRTRESQGLESEWSQVYNMQPQYGPYAVTLQPSTLSYTKREGQESVPSILCSATCKPTCTYKWFKDGKPNSDGATLTLPVTDRSQTGSYKCQAFNTHGTVDSSSVSVDVAYATTLGLFSINSRDDSVTVTVGNPVILRCQVNSNPWSVIQLLNGSGLLTKVDSSLTVTYRLESADCRQRGNYSCTATNNIGAPVTKKVELLVKCSPQLDETVAPQLKYPARLGDDVNVSVTVLGYPLPTFTWSRSISTSQDLTGSSSPVSDISVTARLHLTNLQQQDFGDYSLTLDNGFKGNIVYIISVVPEANAGAMTLPLPGGKKILNQGKYRYQANCLL
ncbi:carcinoembryonic antigen-related cell adhesion molecule 5-like [Haliotis asinina]|uniref:carcinoembryonic antigen-related cell adhesion molecule 5-like n=1 Tax=Haliotis asinina TaxID=109174 RepID=UPI0035327812